MQSYFYVKTCYEKDGGNKKKDKKIRVRVLGGQKLHGKNLEVTLNVSCSKSIRVEYPIGSIFCCEEITKREPSGIAPFYKVPNNKLFVMEVEGEVVGERSWQVEDYEKMYPFMKNEERKLVLDWVLSDEDIPLV